MSQEEQDPIMGKFDGDTPIKGSRNLPRMENPTMGKAWVGGGLTICKHCDTPIHSEEDGFRDKVALSVIPALVAVDGGLYFGTVGKPYDPWPWVAKEAYKAADAMMAEREKK